MASTKRILRLLACIFLGAHTYRHVFTYATGSNVDVHGAMTCMSCGKEK